MGKASWSPHLTTSEPLQPRTLVVVFKESPESGATLGYYGTITRVLNSSVVRHPEQPDWWIYRVFLPHFNRHFDIPARQLIATANVDPTEPSRDPVCELQFDSRPNADNDEIHGAYRLPSRDWDFFDFRKSDQSAPTYQLSMPLELPRKRASKLSYQIPSTEVLDRDYVLRAIGEIIGVELSKSSQELGENGNNR